ncbi:MAG: hypothetical protein ABI182_02745 [Candidatus Baltobacteraceae bacterium]
MSIRRIYPILVCSFCALMAAGGFASASSMQSLTTVAHKYGYTYMERNPENAVELVKSGVDVIIRPGSRLFWVNGTPDATDVVPSYHNRVVYISNNMANELARIARTSSARSVGFHDPPALAPVGDGPLTVTVVGGLGSETLDVFGSAPPNSPISIALSGQISRDLPTVSLSTSHTVAGANGKYTIVVPVGPDYFRGSTIVVNVATAAGAAASASYVLGAPNRNATNLPGDPVNP